MAKRLMFVAIAAAVTAYSIVDGAFTVTSYQGRKLLYKYDRRLLQRGMQHPEEGGDVRDMDALQAWGVQKGATFDNISFSGTAGNDWGCVAPNNLVGGTVVLKVNSSMVLSSARIREDLGEEKSLVNAIAFMEEEERRAQLIPNFYLLVKLAMEYTKGRDSVWYSWINSLPRTFGTAVSMDQVELECLPAFAWTMAHKQRKNWEVFRQALQLVSSDLVDSSVSQDDELTKWLFNCVFSRCWRYSDRVNSERCDIVPLGDMFNHNTAPNTQVDYDDMGNVIFSLSENVEAGQPLHLSYGDATNPYRLLCNFGFVDEGQPEIFCPLVASEASERLEEMGYNPIKMVFRTQDGAISNAAWDVMLYSILEQVPQVQEVFYRAHMEGDTTEVDELLAQIAEENEAAHPRLALIRQHNAFLRRTFQKVKHNLDGRIQSELEHRRVGQAISVDGT
eukprot:scaffold128309_cov49-Attheya_sp.AAC.2